MKTPAPPEPERTMQSTARVFEALATFPVRREIREDLLKQTANGLVRADSR